MLTDETINNEWRKANKQDDSWMPHIHARFARAIESAATTPLLAEIERKQARIDQLISEVAKGADAEADHRAEIERLKERVKDLEDERDQIRALFCKAKDEYHAARQESALRWQMVCDLQASNAQAEPLVLERLSISEAKTIVSQHVEGEMTGDDWTIINAVQSAIAAKNGAKLK